MNEIKYRAAVSYDGTRYDGWQRQKNTEKTIQGLLEDALRKITDSRVSVQGSGRTDAGVHAKAQMIHFILRNEYDLNILKDAINSILPKDIRIYHLKQADANFHSRYSATGKSYSYRIDTGERPCVFTRKYTMHHPQPLNVEAMKCSASYLSGTHNFKSFTLEKDRRKSTVRTISEIKLLQHGNIITIHITGNGFLQNMVRIIAGTIIEVGRNERKPEDMEIILKKHSRGHAGFTAPPCGLCLEEVYYK